jgi:hypothetical protein
MADSVIHGAGGLGIAGFNLHDHLQVDRESKHVPWQWGLLRGQQ